MARHTPQPADNASADLADGPDSTLQLQPGPGHVRTTALDALATRALGYLHAGNAVHFRGPAGSGKTKLALDLAQRLGRPVLLLVGDDSFDTKSLVGEASGLKTRRVVDRYITSVMKVETESAPIWLDRALSIACAEGCTLVYDEFNRAPASANNVLLTVLEERILVLPKPRHGEGTLRVHPEFRAIFTSNPHDHAGAHAAQDALLDRMITIDVEGFDRETEVAIAVAHSGLPFVDAGRIVDMVRDFRRSREWTQRPTLRCSIAIARMAGQLGLRVTAEEERFVQLCLDVLASRLKPGPDGVPDPRHRQMLVRLIEHFCGAGGPAPRGTVFGGVAA
ncbi:gas vesicle protein GvpN [Paracraurococcus ruber]|uniref:Gas vesicle protein GvpN n=1 Tax=Paracraurococcus ruber TaxID=77675 RepID=A0ABS1D7L2_9PROT|nr:gas vesicle protein GvpN [Paracraurococcus ruber]MBK1662551.1 gas vesicle protein GvpN [Paracraurococcus ruber]TDG23001.1 gas vesicle protein GvpN [Paracraurococcus ruber]